jgi:hypothetical protein
VFCESLHRRPGGVTSRVTKRCTKPEEGGWPAMVRPRLRRMETLEGVRDLGSG